MESARVQSAIDSGDQQRGRLFHADMDKNGKTRSVSRLRAGQKWISQRSLRFAFLFLNADLPSF
jgi:hypothetical protein